MKFSLKIFLLAFALCLTALPASASDGVRVGVLRFQSKAEGVADRQAEIITDILPMSCMGLKTSR